MCDGREVGQRHSTEEATNKVCERMAELVEGRPLTEGNSQQTNENRTQSRRNSEVRLLAVRTKAKEDKKERFNNLMTHIDEELLIKCFRGLEKSAAPGCDGITKESYESNLTENIRNLLALAHTGKYKPKPSRRVMIPKEDGSLRPLGIACVEDKLLQAAVVEILNQVYEVDFLGFSYGFRPGRGQHDALDALVTGIRTQRINWILDLDISKFFDTVDHGWMMKFMEHRISDKRVLRLIWQWLTVGVIDENGHRVAATVGTPQGSVISPLLANVYLHYAFDTWVHSKRKKRKNGDVIMIRYADDTVLGFEWREEAEYYLKAIEERLAKFGLQIHPTKTRLIRFGKNALTSVEKEKVGTFDYLGFTHYISKTRKGAIVVKRKTRRKSLRRALAEVKAGLWKRMHLPIWQTGFWLQSVVRGHLNYFGVPFNIRSIQKYVWEVKRTWLWTLRRRSQKGRMGQERFLVYADQFVPKPRIVHPYPEMRFAANHPT